jgi:hypothetical protein
MSRKRNQTKAMRVCLAVTVRVKWTKRRRRRQWRHVCDEYPQLGSTGSSKSTSAPRENRNVYKSSSDSSCVMSIPAPLLHNTRVSCLLLTAWNLSRLFGASCGAISPVGELCQRTCPCLSMQTSSVPFKQKYTPFRLSSGQNGRTAQEGHFSVSAGMALSWKS